ncbi:MAG TPA: phosphatidylglycerol lysyltransferase domain-containing protein, partial [Mobilitalea sp.]|nr:phosphatidylglycerol lysyltransferase domain-containing protein [Mobilitalea sp.]
DGKIVAMSVGEIINDTLYCHIEKADRNYHGSYQMIVREFAKNTITDQVKYINREDDAGDEGLRKSKLSYHPYKLLNKYCVLVPFD